MATSSRLSTVYCTDEDIAVRAGGDFAILCPKWQKLAGAGDGAINAASWTLTSATATFDAAGVTTGHVCWLQKPAATFLGMGDLLAIQSVTATSLSLRRVGLAVNAGQTPVATNTTAITYAILTLGPQIEEASFDLNRRYNIDPSVSGRTPTDVYDIRDLRQATVLTVLVRRIESELQDKSDAAWAMKLKSYRTALDEVLARLSVRWGSTGDTQPPSTWFGTRLVR